MRADRRAEAAAPLHVALLRRPDPPRRRARGRRSSRDLRRLESLFTTSQASGHRRRRRPPERAAADRRDAAGRLALGRGGPRRRGDRAGGGRADGARRSSCCSSSGAGARRSSSSAGAARRRPSSRRPTIVEGLLLIVPARRVSRSPSRPGSSRPPRAPRRTGRRSASRLVDPRAAASGRPCRPRGSTRSGGRPPGGPGGRAPAAGVRGPHRRPGRRGRRAAALARRAGRAAAPARLATPDPFIAAVPALLGLAAALVAMRLYPLAMRAVAAIAGWRRDLVPALALRQAARGGTGGPILLVLLTTVALGAFSSATLVHLDRAADAVAWQETGAAFRVSSSVGASIRGCRRASTGRALPGVEAGRAGLAPHGGLRRPAASASGCSPSTRRPTSRSRPAPPWRRHGRRRCWAPRRTAARHRVERPRPRARTRSPWATPSSVTAEGRELTLQVVEIRPTFASAAGRRAVRRRLARPAPRTTLVGPRRADHVPLPARPRRGVRRYRRGAVGRAAGWCSRAVPSGPPSSAARRSWPRSPSGSPSLRWSRSPTPPSRSRRRWRSRVRHAPARWRILRTLGLTRRQSLGLVVVEHGPTVVVAFVVGTALGLGLFAVLRPGLGLGTVVGSPLDIPLSVDPGPARPAAAGHRRYRRRVHRPRRSPPAIGRARSTHSEGGSSERRRRGRSADHRGPARARDRRPARRGNPAARAAALRRGRAHRLRQPGAHLQGRRPRGRRAAGPRPAGRPGRDDRHRRRVRQRQVDAAQHPRRARHAVGRAGGRRRARPRARWDGASGRPTVGASSGWSGSRRPATSCPTCRRSRTSSCR